MPCTCHPTTLGVHLVVIHHNCGTQPLTEYGVRR